MLRQKMVHAKGDLERYAIVGSIHPSITAIGYSPSLLRLIDFQLYLREYILHND